MFEYGFINLNNGGFENGLCQDVYARMFVCDRYLFVSVYVDSLFDFILAL